MVNGESCKAFVVNRQPIIVNGTVAKTRKSYFLSILQQLNHIAIKLLPQSLSLYTSTSTSVLLSLCAILLNTIAQPIHNTTSTSYKVLNPQCCAIKAPPPGPPICATDQDRA